MTPEISTKWGKKSHVATNEFREELNQENLDDLEWSEKLHTIAYERNKQVAKGIIPIGQSNFSNLLLQAN